MLLDDLHPAPGHPGDAGRAGPPGPGQRQADRGGDRQEVRVRGGVPRGPGHRVAEIKTQNMVHIRRALFQHSGQGLHKQIKIWGKILVDNII